jgi:hypothetical protein
MLSDIGRGAHESALPLLWKRGILLGRFAPGQANRGLSR